jgi:hypothetical protein
MVAIEHPLLVDVMLALMIVGSALEAPLFGLASIDHA